MISKTVLKTGCVASILAAFAGQAAYAQSGETFPMVGIGSGQTARLNILNLAARSPRSSTSCSVELQFLDASGKQIKQSSVQIPAGQSTFLELKQSEVPGSQGRAEIRAVLQFGTTGGAAPPVARVTDCGNLIPSLEVYDQATGKTTLLVTSTAPLPPSSLLPQ